MQASQDHVIIKRIEGDCLPDVRTAIQAQYDGIGNEYDSFLSRLEQATSLELIVPVGESGAYAGGNCSSELCIIEPDNQLDWIIRAILNVIQQSSDNKRVVYHAPCKAIWLGCANIVETINSEGYSQYNIDQLKALLKAAKDVKQPVSMLIFNTRVTTHMDNMSPGMAHYETFFIRSERLSTVGANASKENVIPNNSERTSALQEMSIWEEKEFAVYHRDSQVSLSEDVDTYEDSLSRVVCEALTETGFKVRANQREMARYNQNGLSCGPSAVGEVMDFLISQDEAYDGFLNRPDRGQQRCYDDLSPRFKDANGQPLTREVFMRLVQYYFVAREWQYLNIQHSLRMSVFNCFLRNPEHPDDLYPIPYELLEEYAIAAYPRLFNQPYSVQSGMTTSSVSRVHSFWASGLSQRCRADTNSASFDPDSLQNASSSKTLLATPDRENFAAVRQSNQFSRVLWEDTSSLLFHVITHPWTRYGMLIVYVAAIVGLCIALSALSANPAALALVHGVAISTMGLTAASSVVTGVSGAFLTYGFLSFPKNLDAKIERPTACMTV